MPEIEARYDCPVCLGVKMHKLKISGVLILDLCRRCGGIWFDYGEVQRLRNFQSNVVLNKVELHKDTFRMQCHSCHSFLERNASQCANCGWQNIIDCPVCTKPLSVTTISNLRLDYCKTCKGVWFDNIELSEIWNGHLDLYAKKHLSKSKDIKTATGETAAFFIDVLAYDPVLAIYGAEAAVEVGQALVEASVNAVSSAPEIAGAVVEGAGAIAGAVFEAIAEIIGGIFDAG